MKQDLLSGFDKILVVATNKKALEKAEKELAPEDNSCCSAPELLISVI